jgi:hypothetical protein
LHYTISCFGAADQLKTKYDFFQFPFDISRSCLDFARFNFFGKTWAAWQIAGRYFLFPAGFSFLLSPYHQFSHKRHSYSNFLDNPKTAREIIASTRINISKFRKSQAVKEYLCYRPTQFPPRRNLVFLNPLFFCF